MMSLKALKDKDSIKTGIRIMKRRQSFHEKGCVDSDLENLKISLDYEGWEEDFQNYEQLIIKNGSAANLSLIIKTLTRRQAVWDGNRTSRKLVKLDKWKSKLPYPGIELEFHFFCVVVIDRSRGGL